MKIEQKEQNNTIEFGKLNYGDVFKIDEITYMKKQQVAYSNGNRLNAVNLISGEDREIDIATLVIHYPKARLVLDM